MLLGLNREHEACSRLYQLHPDHVCPCQIVGDEELTLVAIEHREERRRVFWLLYSLDSHLDLSFNSVLSILDSCCQVYGEAGFLLLHSHVINGRVAPLLELIWEILELVSLDDLQMRSMGPPLVASGTGFLEYFLLYSVTQLSIVNGCITRGSVGRRILIASS